MDLSTEEPVAGTSGLQDPALLSRKEKRKQFKKLRRKQIRQQVAEEEKLKDRDGLDDAADQERIQLEEQAEAELFAREQTEHDEQERLWIEREKKAMEDFEHQQEELRKQEEQRETQDPEEDGEYVDDDGPAEIIWKGNEIIVKKRRVKVPADRLVSEAVQDENQATSNPLPPQSTAFAAHSKYAPTPTVSEPTPAFGTEQDKTHCPFHFKTGVCRFGVRCSRVHVYPEHSFTLLMRNMYSGPGLVWENDEGLEFWQEISKGNVRQLSWIFLFDKDLQSSVEQHFEERWIASAFGGWMKGNEQPVYPADSIYVALAFDEMCEDGYFIPHSDEEVAQHYEEFYEDVHSEFLQFGELVNFKVCNNASSHLRGNLYVHYTTEASAQAAYSALNGRFYAGKQITCEFVGITRWRVALCGEYMKGRYRLCSHGSACNFLHCFRNPRGEYDWADWDAPRPRFWVAKMAKLFGYESDLERDGDSHDDSRRRHRSPDSPQQRESRQRERRSRDRHHHSIRDDLDSSVRDRGHRKHENGGDNYRSSSDDPGRSSRHSSHRSRAAHRFSSSKELDERGRGNDWETNHGPLGSRSESVTRDYHELSDGGEQQQKRHASGSFDVQEEADNEFTRDRRASSSRLFQDTDNDSKYKRYRSRDFRGSDRRWSLDLRSSKGRSKTSDSVSPIRQTESRAEEVPLRDKNHEKGVDKARNYRRGRTADYSDSSENSDGDRSHKRHHRHRERRMRKRKKTITPELVIEREYKSPKIDDRWTGIMDS